MDVMHKDRAIWAFVSLLGLGLAAYLLKETGGAGWMPGCVFRNVTGYECPGCGMTRGTHALLNGRVADAFAFNPVGMIIFPLLGILLALVVFAWVKGKPLPLGFYPGRWIAVVIAIVMMVWWVVRNMI